MKSARNSLAPRVRRAVDHPALSAGVLVVLAALGVLAWRNVATGFLPTMDEGAFVLDFFMPPGTSLDETRIGEAYLRGDIDFEGDMLAALDLRWARRPPRSRAAAT